MKTRSALRYIESKRGYAHIKIDGVWWLEHRYNWQQANGTIPPGMFIHHRNHARADNRLANLEAVTLSQHNHIHKTKAKVQCSIEHCQRSSEKRGMCNVHYVSHFRKDKVNAYRKIRYHANLEERRRYAREWQRRKVGTPPARFLRPD